MTRTHIHKVLVIGGGIRGTIAALDLLTKASMRSHLVERELRAHFKTKARMKTME